MTSKANDHIDDIDLSSVIEIDASSTVVDELENFRLQWKSEVAAKSKILNNSSVAPIVPLSQNTKTDEARKYFLKGIESERNGQMNFAIKSYRAALQLDPDIEQRLGSMPDFEHELSDDDDDDIENDFDQNSMSLIEKFSNLSLADNTKSEVHGIFHLTNNLNIIQLPSEIVMYIFRWVASNHLDMKSIEALSQTCRLFYIHARDNALWKAACEKIWGVNLHNKIYIDWRKMYIERPHVRLDGVYICKISYFRQGDPTGLSPNYEPFQCVEYFRYLRFLEDNKMILYTSSDEPALVIPRLNMENASQLQFRVGHYKSHSEKQKKFKTVTITGILIDCCNEKYSRQYHNRPTKSEKKYILKETEYFLDLELNSTSSKKRFNKLTWLNYSCRFKYSDGHTSPLSDISLRDQYPPFYHSKVRSYNKKAINVL